MRKSCAVRRSCCCDARSCACRRLVNSLINRPIPSITANVITYSVSLTANVNCGGTKKKSNTKTLAIADAIDGPRPSRAETKATPARKIITMLVSAKPAACAAQANQTAHRDDGSRLEILAPAN